MKKNRWFVPDTQKEITSENQINTSKKQDYFLKNGFPIERKKKGVL
jgi:hypothetical protein